MIQKKSSLVHVIGVSARFFRSVHVLKNQHRHQSLLITNELDGQCTLFTLFLLYDYMNY